MLTDGRTVWLLRLYALLLLVSFVVGAASDVYPLLLVAIAIWFALLFLALWRGGRNWWVFEVVYTVVVLLGAALGGELLACVPTLALLGVLLSSPIRHYVRVPSERVSWSELIGRSPA